MTRQNFLNLNFPILPYCETHRGASTAYNESFHIKNSNTGIQLNFYYRDDDTVSAGIFYENEKDNFKKFGEVLRSTNKFNQNILDKLCDEYLK